MPYATIDKPSKYFNTLTYTGDSVSPRTLTGVGFQPDFVWIRNRDQAGDSGLYDAIRGTGNNKDLVSETTGAEGAGGGDGYGYLSGFTSDGFATTTGSTAFNITNTSGIKYVAWNWLGANTTASNTSGTITSTVSANTTSGFSIIKFTASGSGNQSVGHGLGVAPKMFITKATSSSSSWNVYHASLNSSSPQDYYLNLDLSNASSNLSGVFGAGMTSSVCGVGVGVGISSGVTYIGYAFAEVKGYSKFGSYIGNGSANGTFIYTGFKPAFVLRRRTDSSQDWLIQDNRRTGINQTTSYTSILKPNSNGAELGFNEIDILSNGFKCRASDTHGNASGGNYIYMAFADNPFVSSKGIPTTAR
jgi:hypothetical protein